jgi:hypothetical protein
MRSRLTMHRNSGRVAVVLAATLVAPFSVTPAQAEWRLFDQPQVKGMRLDWCLYWAQDCGEPAADAFCRIWGFEGALRYAIDQNVGRRGVVTVVLGDGRLCGAATCSGFRWVTCERE